MSRLKLRTFSIAIILVGSTLGLALNFSDSLLASSNAQFNESDEINQLRSDFANESNTIKNERTEAQGVDIQTDFFFLTGIWNIMKTTVSGVGNVLNLIYSAASLTGLNIPSAVLSLAGIIVVGVIFAVVAAARGWDV